MSFKQRHLLLTVTLSLLCAPLSGQECLDCHGDPAVTKDAGGGKTVSVHVDPARFSASVHGSLSCTDCHTTISEYPHEKVAPADCSTCHAEAVEQYATSIHAKSRAGGDAAAAACVDCHGKHDILPRSDPASKTNRFRIPATCASCHTNASVTKSHPMPGPEAINRYFESVHGKGTLEKGLNVSAVCSDCHGAHAVLPHEDPSSSISHKNVPLTCRKCHEGIFVQFEQSSHGQAWKSGNAGSPVCVTCHTAHGIKPIETPSFRLGIATECGNCHAQHAPTWRDSFHGQASELGYVAAAKCSDCHTAHLNLPRSDPRSSVAPANVVKTCARCHPNATANFATFQPHADPHDKIKSPQLYYVYNYMMKWLLLMVFGFFGLHTFLWLQRSVAAGIRHEFPRHDDATQWVLRFEKRHRFTHVAIVVSFLALAATGLPLMYSHTAWGQALAQGLGGVGITTVIHRLFAVVTAGYALYHLSFLIRGAFVRRDRNMFFGPDSMMPGVRDLVDMKNMFKWFFYAGPFPRLDRWTYWEKFDYFAVFWGVPVIGLSGLMLWIPEAVTRLLPGWALNVAMLVHGDEALLAIGFIFTFHFFHNHLRPENFPLDPVMFTGRIPLEKFKAERRDQYERLLREKKLETIFTHPPTRRQILFSKWFGFTTYSIGVVLIIAIYASFLMRLFAK
jgi:cytochrome b subunit of formate dehydrogenase